VLLGRALNYQQSKLRSEKGGERTSQTMAAKSATLNIAYQPFLSSTRRKQLTSLLSSSLPYCNFLPINDTSLNLPNEARIILISRGGKPFAPVNMRPSIDSPSYPDILKDLNRSSQLYQKYLAKWEEIQSHLPGLLLALRKHFPERVIMNETFRTPLKTMAATGKIKDVQQVRQLIERFRSLRRSQLFLHPILSQTRVTLKNEAQKAFGVDNLRRREYVIEHHRDRLDLVRFELEKRYMGMGRVAFPERVEARPWVLLPEDPVGAWGQDFPYRVGQLIRLAQVRFLATEEEKEMVLEQEAKGVIEDNTSQIAQNARILGITDAEGVLKAVKDQLRVETERLYQNDRITLALPGNVGDLGPEFRSPVTREDKAAYQVTDQKLIPLGSWRVDD
jgi:hypothetical protein